MTSVKSHLATAKFVFRASQIHAQSPDLLPSRIKICMVLCLYIVNWDLHSRDVSLNISAF